MEFINYINEIKKLLNNDIITIELISNTNNIVYRVNTNRYGIVYSKVYLNNSSHIDNEICLYDLIDKKYLKELIIYSNNPKIAIYKELKGKTIDLLTKEELIKNKNTIIDSIIDFYETIGSKKINGYGLLDENLNGRDSDFNTFIYNRQIDTQNILKDYNELNSVFSKIYDKYKDLIVKDNSLVPIDTNLKNIMLTQSGIKFIDPGELISGPKLMGYGDFVAHIYKTELYDLLISKLNLSKDDLKRLRIYAVFSSLNILAFLKKIGVEKLDTVIPYGNKYTFYNLIDEHLKELKIVI